MYEFAYCVNVLIDVKVRNAVRIGMDIQNIMVNPDGSFIVLVDDEDDTAVSLMRDFDDGAGWIPSQAFMLADYVAVCACSFLSVEDRPHILCVYEGTQLLSDQSCN